MAQFQRSRNRNVVGVTRVCRTERSRETGQADIESKRGKIRQGRRGWGTLWKMTAEIRCQGVRSLFLKREIPRNG